MGTNFDDFMFMAIKESKSMEDILQRFFSFLRRHTDFYHTMLPEEELKRHNLQNSVNSRGFRENEMVRLVNKILQENLTLYRKSNQPYLLDPSQKKTTENAKQNDEKEKREAPKGVLTPDVKKKPNYTINPWNGALTEKYAWTQSFRELTVEVVIPENLSPKNASILITKDSLKVQLQDQVLVEGKLCRQVNASESFWIIEDGSRILINLEKSEEYWWDCVLKGDETIDTQQIESVKRLDEFTPSEQSAILKMVKDHKEKNNL